MSKNENKKNKKVILEYEDPLAQIFLQPFKDIVDTARHGLEKTTAAAWGNTAKLAGQAAATLIPGLAFDAFVQNADEKIKAKLGQIDGKYKDVIERNYNMLKSRDLWAVTWFLNPALQIQGFDFAAKAPELALTTLEALTGGNETITKMKNKYQNITQKLTGGGYTNVGSGAGNVGGDYFGGDDMGGFGFGESITWIKGKNYKSYLLFEQEGQQQQQAPNMDAINKNLADQISKAANHPKIKAAIANSPLTQQLRQMAMETVLQSVQEEIAFKTFDEMKSKLGSKFAAEADKMLSELPETDDEQKVEQFKQQLVAEMKKNIKQTYIQQVKQATKNSPEMAKPVEQLIKQISGLQ